MLQIFFDDSARNIATGKAAGFHTVVVSEFTVGAFLEDSKLWATCHGQPCIILQSGNLKIQAVCIWPSHIV